MYPHLAIDSNVLEIHKILGYLSDRRLLAQVASRPSIHT